MAILSGPELKLRQWRRAKTKNLTKGEKVCRFAETFLRVPEGEHVGEPLVLDDFQVLFICCVLDNPHHTKLAVLSMARRNGKTFLVAILALAFVVGPLAVPNSVIASAAHSREQAALIFRFMQLMVVASPELQSLCRIIPSTKRILGLARNTEFYALSADAKTGFGRSLRVVILDESGQFKGPANAYISMLETSQGSYEDSLFLTISTQAASDNDWLSVTIDDAAREESLHTVVHLYAADKDSDIMDEEQWAKANPGLGNFRSKKDLSTQLDKAKRLPAQAASAMNLLLNQRIAQEQLWLSPPDWKLNASHPDLEAFRGSAKVAVGLDLSTRTDLTAAVFAVKGPEGEVHLLPFGFTPADGLRARSARDRAPYDLWVREGQLFTCPGATVDYKWVSEFLYLKAQELGIHIDEVCFDRWRIDVFRKAAEETGFGTESEWLPVGQGYKDMSPRLESFESLLLSHKLCHGSHPLLNMGAAGAISVSDPAGNRKLEKSRSTARIDVIVAAVMAAYSVAEGNITASFDVAAVIG